MKSPAVGDKVSVVEKIGYGFGDFGSNVVFQAVMMLLPLFYTDVFGLSAGAMGMMFLVVRMMDAVTDPIMGSICDNTNTRWGKFRPYLIWTSLPFVIACVVAFTTPNLEGTAKLLYAYITYSVLMLFYTAVNIPYTALGGVITSDTRERVSLNSYRFAMASLAGVLIASLTLPLANRLGGGSYQRGFQLVMILFGALAFLSFLACFFLTKERVHAVKETRIDVKRDLLCLLKNDQWIVISLLFFFTLTAVVMRNGAAAYYIKWYAGREDLIALFLTVGTLCQVAGASLASTVNKRLSIKTSFLAIHSVIVVASVGMFFLPAAQVLLMFVLYGLVQFLVQMGAAIVFTMTADTVEYGEHKEGRRITGMVFSGTFFFLKLGVAFGGAALAWVLAGFGYAAGGVTAQSDSAITGILLASTLLPAVGHLLLLPIAAFYKLDSDRIAEIKASLAVRE